MAALAWFRSPWRRLGLFLAVTLIPAAALLGLGWKIFDQDRELQRLQLQNAVDRLGIEVVAGLQRDLSGIPTALRDAPASIPEWARQPGMTAVSFGNDGVAVEAGTALPFLPSVAGAGEPPSSLWRASEIAEAQRHDHAGAIALLDPLARDRDVGVRAGALVRIARNQRQQDRLDAAIRTYRALAALTGTRVFEQPADLLARRAIASLLAQSNRRDESRREAVVLARDLDAGHFAVDRATFLETREALIALAGGTLPDTAPATAARTLAEATELLWVQRHREGSASRSTDWQIVWVDTSAVVALTQTGSHGLHLWLATADSLRARWSPIWTSRGAAVLLADGAGHHIFGSTPADTPVSVQTIGDTHLPFELKVWSVDPSAVLVPFANQRRLLILGTAAVALLVLAGGAVVIRGVQKEVAVARLQSDFVAAVSHEFRTPLTSLDHLTELLRGDRPIAEERRRQYYDMLSAETTRLRRFVETLLEFGRMEAGVRPFRLEPLAPADLMTDIVSEFRREPVAESHTIQVHTSEAPVVCGDREALGHAVRNLLENAAKYSPAGTDIDVSVGHEAEGVVLRVRDWGPGIPAHEQKRIFDRFVRGADALRSHVKGTGVGLAMVDYIVRAHGGRVRVESAPGQGSTFSIVLPAAAQDGSRI